MADQNNYQSPRLDAYLTNFATTYRLEERAGDFVAPPFKVARARDRFVQFGKGKLRVYDTAVARQERAKTIELEWTDATYVCREQAIASFVATIDQDLQDPGFRTDEIKTSWTLDAHRLARENRVFQVATSPSLVPLNSTPSTKWDVAGGTPVANILNAMAAVKDASTKTPNRIVMSLKTALKLIQTTEYKDYFKYNTSGFPNLFNAISGFEQLGLKPMIAGAYGVNTAMGTASDPGIEAVIGNNVVLFYGEDTPTIESRVFMYSPYVRNEQIFRIIEQRERGYYIETRSTISELLVDPYCAYLYTNVLT